MLGVWGNSHSDSDKFPDGLVHRHAWRDPYLEGERERWSEDTLSVVLVFLSGFNFFFFFFFLIIVHYILLVSMRDISEGASLGSEKIPRACQEGSLLREGCAVDMWAQQEARCV
jgi:hypothetical protein